MTLERFAQILSEYQSIDPTSIKENTTFKSLGLDSLDILQIITAIEEETGITIQADESLETVGSVLGYINAGKA